MLIWCYIKHSLFSEERSLPAARKPNAPAALTWAASAPPLAPAIGAAITGVVTPMHDGQLGYLLDTGQSSPRRRVSDVLRAMFVASRVSDLLR